MEPHTRILVVDDEAEIAGLVSELLSSDGVEVTHVTSPNLALDVLRARPHQLLITDLRMPEMSGHELIEEARAIDPDLPVVIVTGFGTVESAVEALRQRVDDYLTKPFDLQSLTRVVERVLRTRQLEFENRRLVTELRKVNHALRSHRDLLQHEIADATRDITRTNQELQGKIRDLSLHQRIHRIGTSTEDLGALLTSALEVTCQTLSAELGSVLLLDEGSQELEVSATFGERQEPIRSLKRPVHGGIIGRVADEGRLLRDNRSSMTLLSRRRKYRTRHFLSTPLKIGRKTIGVINVSDPESRQPFSRDCARVLTSVARELALLVDRLVNEQHRQTDCVSTIRTLVESLEAKAPYFRGHSERVANLSLELAQKIGLGEADQLLLQRASYLHDVGKIGIPDSILHKKETLTEEEMAVVREHPAIGADLIRRFDFLETARPLIRHHHERWDGKGYPDRLVAEEIPFLASIITVADSYDAMLSARPYRKELTRDIARRELIRGAGTQFHPSLVLSFCSRTTTDADTPATNWTDELKRVEEGRSKSRGGLSYRSP